MKRETEPELMNTKEQVISYSGADFSEGENDFIMFIKKYLKNYKVNLNINDVIVDIGCGPGNISKKLAIEWPDINIFGIDGSRRMISEANAKKENNAFELKNLRYFCSDIRDFDINDFAFNKISLLVSNSLIHHITHIDQFFECIEKLSTKETLNFHKDLRRPKDMNSALKLKNECALMHDDVLTNDYFASLKASYTKNELRNTIINRKLDYLDVIEDGNKYLIVYGKV